MPASRTARRMGDVILYHRLIVFWIHTCQVSSAEMVTLGHYDCLHKRSIAGIQLLRILGTLCYKRLQMTTSTMPR
jgi:hypothetical protein